MASGLHTRITYLVHSRVQITLNPLGHFIYLFLQMLRVERQTCFVLWKDLIELRLQVSEEFCRFLCLSLDRETLVEARRKTYIVDDSLKLLVP